MTAFIGASERQFWMRRVGGVLAIFIGATIGALLVTRSGLSLPLAIAGALTLGGTIACSLHPAAAEPLAG